MFEKTSDVSSSPRLHIENIDLPENYIVKNPKTADAVDTLPFDPMAMDNNVYSIRTEVELSTMTMGQDQRHRTIARGLPHITGNFYLPPLLKIAGLENAAEDFQDKWIDLIRTNPDVANFVAPYGAIVRYQKRIGLNALLHEQEKRLCWCAQEEIYNLNIQLVNQLDRRGYAGLVNEMKPHCAKYGVCLEGSRYCGRDMSVWQNGALAGFAQRQI
jgi:hypothetical protein